MPERVKRIIDATRIGIHAGYTIGRAWYSGYGVLVTLVSEEPGRSESMPVVDSPVPMLN